MDNYPVHLLGGVAFELPGERKSRLMGKVLASALLRSIFDAQITLFRNVPQPVFLVERVGLHEVEVLPDGPLTIGADLAPVAINWRFNLAEHLAALPCPGWTILSDLDVVPLRNWDHLFERRDIDILIHRDTKGHPDPGFFAVRGERMAEFALAWRKASEEPLPRTTIPVARKDQRALIQVIASGNWKVSEFERGEVVRPFDAGVGLSDTLHASVVHLAGGSQEQKVKLSFALYMMWVYGDDSGVFLDLLES